MKDKSYSVIGVYSNKSSVNDFSFVVIASGLINTRTDIISLCRSLRPAEIILLEKDASSYDVDALVSKNDDLRVINFSANVSTGEMLNVAISEAVSPYVFVIDSGFSDIVYPGKKIDFPDDVSVVTFARAAEGEVLPSVFVPFFEKKRFRPLPVPDPLAGDMSIQLASFSGVYNKVIFETLGGFDSLIDIPYWQRLDFSLRTYMWGYRIVYEPSIRVEVDVLPDVEDMTAYESYFRFFLKTLAVKIEDNNAYLPFFRFFLSALKAKVSMSYAFSQYKDVKLWVNDNKKNIKYVVETVFDLWSD